MNLLLLETAELQEGNRATLAGPRAEHVRTVLRAEPGETLRVGLRDGGIGRARIDGWTAEGALVLDPVSCTEEPPPRAAVSLLLAMPRPKALRRLLPALASLGLNELVVINAARVDRAYLDSPVLAPDAVRRLFDLGLEQAIDTRSPGLRVERRFRPFVEDTLPALVEGTRERWLLDPGADRTAGAPTGEPGHRWLAVGPETGWTDFERDLLRARGFSAISLGSRTLRVETVVPYAIGRLCPAPIVRAST